MRRRRGLRRKKKEKGNVLRLKKQD